METALCKICQLTGVLCRSCEKKFGKGEISQLDIDVSVFLGQKTRGKKELEDIEFQRALYIDDHIVLFFKKGDLNKLYKHGRKVLEEMKRKFRAKVLPIEYHHDLREFLEGLFYPTEITAIKTIWLPDGSRETRILLGERVSKRRAKIANMIAKQVKNVEVKVESHR